LDVGFLQFATVPPGKLKSFHLKCDEESKVFSLLQKSLLYFLKTRKHNFHFTSANQTYHEIKALIAF